MASMGKLSTYLRNETPFIAIYHVPEAPEGSESPDESIHCVFKSMFIPALKGHTIAARKDQMGCGGSHNGLGMGGESDRKDLSFIYSTGLNDRPGAGFYRDPEIASASLGFMKAYGTGNDYCVMEPLDKAESRGAPIEVVAILTDNVRISALSSLIGYDRAPGPHVHMVHAFACEELYALPKAESEKGTQDAFLGATELYVRKFVRPEEMTFAVPYEAYKRMESNADKTFLANGRWEKALGDLQENHSCCM